MAKLNAREVNCLKYQCEGRDGLERLYNRLTWNVPKTVRLSFNEKELLHELLGAEEEYFLDNDAVLALAKATGMLV